jgi:hypothetical protein
MGEDALGGFGETVVGELMDPEKEVDDDRPADGWVPEPSKEQKTPDTDTAETDDTETISDEALENMRTSTNSRIVGDESTVGDEPGEPGYTGFGEDNPDEVDIDSGDTYTPEGTSYVDSDDVDGVSNNVVTVESESDGGSNSGGSGSSGSSGSNGGQSSPEITVDIPGVRPGSSGGSAGGMLGGMDSQTLLVGALALGGIGLAYAFGGN